MAEGEGPQKELPCRFSQKPNADSCGRSIPISQKLGLTASPLLPANASRRVAPGLLAVTEGVLAGIDICLGTNLESRDGNGR